ncbi:CYTH domain-containing protein, partial [Diaphorobacter sp.]
MSPLRTPVAAAPAAGAEIELKLALPAGGGAALLRKLAAVPALARVAPVRQQLHNQYFDTPAQDLRARRAALRLRRVQGAGAGEQWLQTLKTADAELSALSQRGEWETPVPGPALQPKALRAAPPWRRLDPD